MDRLESLSHSKWEWKYHVVFIPKRRRKTLDGALRKYISEKCFIGWRDRRKAGSRKGI